MPLQDLSPPPVAPSRSDAPETFIARADDFLAWIAAFATQMGVLVPQLEATAALIAAAPAYADPGLVALTGNTPAADKVPYFTGSATSTLAVLTAAGRALIGAANAGAQLDALGLSPNGKSLITAADYPAMRGLMGVPSTTEVASYVDALVEAAALLTKIKTVDGAGSGLDADLVRGHTPIWIVDSDGDANGGWDLRSDGRIECWGKINVPANNDATWPLPKAHTAEVWPSGMTSVPLGDTAQYQNIGVASINFTSGAPVSITFQNAGDGPILLYVRTTGK